MTSIARITRQCWNGLPYLQKELGRRASLYSGQVLATPMTYYIIFGGRCNLACSFCEVDVHSELKLSREAMLRVIREAKDLSGSGFNISLSGGEPTIYKPLIETLQLASDIGVNMGFTTNGLSLIESNVKRILACNPFNINVSLESVDPKVNESLRPAQDGTRRTLRGIDNVLAEKARTGARTSVIVKPTIMEQNYRGLPDLVRHFGKQSPVQINFQPYVGMAGSRFWVSDLANLRRVFDELLSLQQEGYRVMASPQQYESFNHYFANPPKQGAVKQHLDLGGQKRNCDIGLRSMFLYADGDVFFCDYLGKPVGNIHQNSLSEIYYGQAAGGQRKQMVYCNIDCQQTCKRPIPLLVKARSFLRMY